LFTLGLHENHIKFTNMLELRYLAKKLI